MVGAGLRLNLLIAAVLLGLGSPAHAQGFLDALFGGFRPPAPQHATSYAEPSESRREAAAGHGPAFCVRTCDGRYFALPRQSGVTPAELCRSFCPAAKTAVFSGSRIESAVGQNGARYADLDTAFAYRDKVTDNCSCNGKDGLGLARVNPMADPTLRVGDIVATDTGLATYSSNANKTAEFTPISASSSELLKRLSDVKIEPAPPMEAIEPPPADEPKPAKRGRVQASR